MTFDDETLMAYADGELDDKRRREIEAALALDPELVRRVDAHRRLRAQVSDHYQAELEAPVPDAVMALLQPAQADAFEPESDTRVLPFIAPAVNDRRAVWTNLTAIAASLLIGALVGSQWLGRDSSAVLLQPTPDGLFAAGPLEAALTGDASGTTGRDGIRMILTFPATDGSYCRSFTTSGVAGIACRDDAGWQVRSTGSLPVSSGGEIRTAGSTFPAVLLEEIDRISAGDPLDSSGEAELIARGWRPAD
ncbi:hypothetical protein [uncultured Maricaulis sp.]|uniref:anti-sigma factor n=1 Tax=uncultured Maricaulis sp. TaxID=174710 RepID=UPI0030D7018A|tara:strand:+ start:237087 stop:237836 length:750 start_codon:yes stop_codon:yes gene_type:complete